MVGVQDVNQKLRLCLRSTDEEVEMQVFYSAFKTGTLSVQVPPSCARELTCIHRRQDQGESSFLTTYWSESNASSR